MIIEKYFEDFKSIVTENETRNRLFERGIGTNILEKIFNHIFIDDITEISVERIEKNRLFITFREEKEITTSYQIEFIKRPQDGYIEIKNNHPLTSIYFSRFNRKIKNRIIENWDKLTK